ncbi:MAG: DUF2161 family putative PD-(D/E)XK-type phosphodiesterase [Armatimonadota bacterium]
MPRDPRPQAETDLYPPLHRYLTDQGYTVRSEVKHSDITATKDDDLVIIELKRTFGTTLLVQAIKRQKVTPSVYVALPRPKPGKAWTGIKQLLRRLELGLIFVSTGRRGKPVEVVFHPVPFQQQRKKRLKRAYLQEIAGRSADYNVGGMNRRKVMSAYREACLYVACCLDHLGPLSPKQLRALGADPRAQSIVYSDFFDWFERVDHALYALSPRGREAIAQHTELAETFRKRIEEAETNKRLPLG